MWYISVYIFFALQVHSALLEACVECVRFQELPLIVVHQSFGTRSSHCCCSWMRGGGGGGGPLEGGSWDTQQQIQPNFRLESEDCACAALFNLNYLAVNKAQWDRAQTQGWVREQERGEGTLLASVCKNEIFISSSWIWIEATDDAENREPSIENPERTKKGINIYNHKNLAERSSAATALWQSTTPPKRKTISQCLLYGQLELKPSFGLNFNLLRLHSSFSTFSFCRQQDPEKTHKHTQKTLQTEETAQTEETEHRRQKTISAAIEKLV